MRTFTYQGTALRAAAMPLGGLGAGSLALAGDGGLRQWQIFNNVNHLAYVPHSFFALWCRLPGREAAARVLMSDALYDDRDFVPSASVSDHEVPQGARQLLSALPGVQRIELAGGYPIARLTYHDSAIPLRVSLEAFSPFLPLEAEDSGLPAVLFEFGLHNLTAKPVQASLLATLQNAVGWDGLSPISEVENVGYGGNENSVLRRAGVTALLMANPHLAAHHPHAGTLALAVLGDDALGLAAWDDLRELWREFQESGRLPDGIDRGPSAEGRTWNGALALPLVLAPGESHAVAVALSWHFPNRQVDWDQTRYGGPGSEPAYHVGCHYARRFTNAMDVVRYVQDHRERLTATTRRFRDSLLGGTLPEALLDAVSSQLSTPRSPTCLWAGDGHFYGFEGCRGASTREGKTGGCCPLNCTHVWNYALSLARLFPELEQRMREIDLLVQMSPQGTIPHRTVLPLDLPRPWGQRSEGPEHTALDGELGTVLKVYREVRQGAGEAWLGRLWSAVRRLLAHVMDDCDPDADGIIKGEQPNTYDISFYGPNSFVGGLYLAALRAGEEMALLMGESAAAAGYRARFEQGRERLDALLWNGEYYTQEVDLREHPEDQYGQGCHSDQLLGQWWAHLLDLGYILPRAHVRQALEAIVRYNWRPALAGFRQQPRVYADEDEPGLLNCTWPRGGRPAKPARYSEEIWTGIEYEVAALLLWEGMTEEALRIVRGVRARYDGRRRNPWNEVECGDHYVRAMSSWALMEAASGYRYDACRGSLAFAPCLHPEDERFLFVAAKGWGSFAQRVQGVRQREALDIAYGELVLRTFSFRRHMTVPLRSLRVALDGRPLTVDVREEGRDMRIAFEGALTIAEGARLEVQLQG